MGFSNKDFNADIKQNEEFRKYIARIYEFHPTYFGLVSVNPDALPGEMKSRRILQEKGTKEFKRKSKNYSTYMNSSFVSTS